MNLSAETLRMFGWVVEFTVPDYPKCIICVAPHTSNWDFILGELAIHAVGRKVGFMMKSSWFFFPLGPIFKALGGIPVERKHKKSSLVESMVARFKSESHLTVAIAPEGTRKKTAKWHTGFLRIAYQADVPIALGAIDYARKLIKVTDTFIPTGDVEADIAAIKSYYRPFTGRYPNKFSTENDS